MSKSEHSEANSKASPPDDGSALHEALTADPGAVGGTDGGVERPTADSVPEVGAGGSPRPAIPPAAVVEGTGTRIGPYKLLQKLGEGGMGAVYEAEQERPVRRRVALKVIKPGMDTDQVVARFEAEQQALALMDHANIARVIDAGATDSGRPYFVMELVHGIPLTRYCDENKLTPRARLELFIAVCHAIQHAHQKGIIHRDIKPSNVLVTLYDGKPVPKVIDFGIAKATEQRLTERTMFTQHGSIIGTLEYMAPEQADLSALGVDTRSDIYSLGVMLYELLTGTTPLRRKQGQEIAYVELVRMLKEDEPPRPSTRLSQSGDTLTAISSKRGTEPGQLRKAVRGDLDWIVMKCLEKDRTRRYETANGLARDIERYLHDEPVEACPPSTGYRLRKLALRYRAALATAAAFVSMLVVGVIIAAWLAVQANRAKQQAVSAEADERAQRLLVETERNRAIEAEAKASANAARANAALTEANRQKDEADRQKNEADHQKNEANRQKKLADQNFRKAKQAVDQYLTHVGEDPELADNPDLLPLRDKLYDSALKFYETFAATATDDPAILAEQAAAHFRIGRTMHTQGKNTWLPDFEKGVNIATGLVERPATREQLAPLTEALFTNRDQTQFLAPRELNRSVRVFEQAVKTWSTLVARYPDVPAFQNDLGGVHHILASLELAAGHRGNATSAFLRAGKLFEALVKKYPNNPEYLASLAVHLTNKGLYMYSVGQTSSAINNLHRATDLLSRAIKESPATRDYKCHLCLTGISLSVILANGKQFTESEKLLRSGIATLEELSRQYPHAVVYRSLLANSYANRAIVLVRSAQKGDEAIAEADKSFAQLRQIQGMSRPSRQNLAEVALTARTVGMALAMTTQFADSAAAYKYSSELYARLMKETPEDTTFDSQYVEALNFLAVAQAVAAPRAEYAATCATLVERLRPGAKPQLLDLTVSVVVLHPDAIKDFGVLVGVCQEELKKIDAATISYHQWRRLEQFGMLFYRAGQFDQALVPLNQWRTLREKRQQFRADPPIGLFTLAMTHERLGHREDAQKYLEEAANRTARALGEVKLDRTPSDPIASPNWLDRQVLKLYRREAEDLIRQNAAKPVATHDTKPTAKKKTEPAK
jgi:serine/threonine protein kinase/tetratricopeptide (TPR) repeat protein